MKILHTKKAMIKTVLSSVALLAILTPSLASASQKEKTISLKVASINLLDTTATQYGFSYGGTIFSESHISFGVDFLFDYASMKGEHSEASATLYSYGSNLHIGYGFLENDLNTYVTGGALIQSVGTSAYGFGYGLGLDYKLAKFMRVGAEYLTYSMSVVLGSYDYSQTSAYVSFVY